jgi:hypothetical protein
MNFRHLVGRSTLKEGITVHKSFESFFETPDIGSKRGITILFGNGNSTTAVLRKLNNVRQHVHIKYTSKANMPFIDWLKEMFPATASGRVGEFLEFKKVSRDVYQAIPLPIAATDLASLYIANSTEHKSSGIDDKEALFEEIGIIVDSIKFRVDEGQSYYNRELEAKFGEYGWDKEGRAIPELDLKYDFRKRGFQLEVEFGNARSYYQDYIKFMPSYHSKQIQMGILVTPTFGFANTLCEIGKQRALLRGKKSYSGMMHFEKAQREFRYLKDIFDMPIAIIGIDINPASDSP